MSKILREVEVSCLSAVDDKTKYYAMLYGSSAKISGSVDNLSKKEVENLLTEYQEYRWETNE